MAIMTVGLIGLGKMGNAIAYRLLQAGHTVIGYDTGQQARAQAAELGITLADDIPTLAAQARIVWLMVPAGSVIDVVIEQMMPQLHEKDIIIDGGNSYFADSVKRAQLLEQKNIFFLDCGTSGGLAGRDIGFCLMVGGDRGAFDRAEPVLKAIAADHGYGHVGPSGAGHYVKMIHNGIEYALLQAYAEGFHLFKEGRYKHLDLAQISDLWMHGSVIRSWILELAHNVFVKDQELRNISGFIAESGTGAWTVAEAHEQGIPVTLIEDALKIRAGSRTTGGDFATKVVAMLRHEFGGHEVKKIKES